MLLGLQQPYRDVAVFGAELAAIMAAFLVIRLVLRVVRPDQANAGRSKALFQRAYGAASVLLLVITLLFGSALLAFDVYLLVGGESVFSGTLSRLERLPSDFVTRAGILVLQLAGAVVMTVLSVWTVDFR